MLSFAPHQLVQSFRFTIFLDSPMHVTRHTLDSAVRGENYRGDHKTVAFLTLIATKILPNEESRYFLRATTLTNSTCVQKLSP